MTAIIFSIFPCGLLKFLKKQTNKSKSWPRLGSNVNSCNRWSADKCCRMSYSNESVSSLANAGWNLMCKNIWKNIWKGFLGIQIALSKLLCFSCCPACSLCLNTFNVIISDIKDCHPLYKLICKRWHYKCCYKVWHSCIQFLICYYKNGH